MKKRFGMYATAWILLLALFNLIVFITPGEAEEKFTASFWIGYTMITVGFLGQLLCGYVALKEENSQKLFYRLSLAKTSYSGLFATFFVGILCMAIPALPYWIGVILCAVVLVINVLALLKAGMVVSEVERIDQKVKMQTFFIKSLAVDADSLMARAQSDAVREECRKVYEAVRYSDPMSNEMLAAVESQITLRVAALSEAVAADDAAAVTAIAAEVQILLRDRNNKCRLLK